MKLYKIHLTKTDSFTYIRAGITISYFVMNVNKFFRTVTVGVLWLCMGASCQKDPPAPKCDASCCFTDPLPQYDLFAARLDGALLSDIKEVYVVLKDPVFDVTLKDRTDLKDSEKSTRFLLACQKQATYLKELEAKLKADPNYAKQQYAVWGNVYWDFTSSTFNPYPKPYAVYIEKIERVR